VGRGRRRSREAFATERAGGAADDGAARLGGGRVGGGTAQVGRRDAAARRGAGGRLRRQECGRRRGEGRAGRLGRRAGGGAAWGEGQGGAPWQACGSAAWGGRRDEGRAGRLGGRVAARRACVRAARWACGGVACVRAGGRRGAGLREAWRGECGQHGGGAAIQTSKTSEREAVGARPGRFRASIFVGRAEADENSGRSMTYFRRHGPGPRKYATFSSVKRPMKITSIFSWPCRRKYSPAHENTPHFRRSRGRRK
jgi:hypothetical protein